MIKRAMSIAERRLNALPRSAESDDLAWAAQWMDRDPSDLLLEFSRMVKAGERIPNPLLLWLADAAEASMVKSPESRGNELLLELGLKRREGRPPTKLPRPSLLRIERWNGGHTPRTIRQLAMKYGVSVGAVQAQLNKKTANPGEIAELLRGLNLVRRRIKL